MLHLVSQVNKNNTMKRFQLLKALPLLICIATYTCTEASTGNSSELTREVIKGHQEKRKLAIPTQVQGRTVSVAGVSSGKRSVGQLIKAGGLLLDNEGKSESVYSYLVSIEFPSGKYQEVLCSTARFNLNVIQHLKKCKSGTKVRFENIKVRLSDRSIEKAPSFTITISKEAVKE